VVGTGAYLLIAGFNLGGNGTKKVLSQRTRQGEPDGIGMNLVFLHEADEIHDNPRKERTVRTILTFGHEMLQKRCFGQRLAPKIPRTRKPLPVKLAT
jgi:hypothetical protein